MGSKGVMFEAGDKVVCKDPEEATRLRLGGVYTVEKVEKGRIFPQRVWLAEIKNDGPEYYSSERFDLYLEEPWFPSLISDDFAPADPVDPNHYARFPIQPITFITKNKLEFWQGNIIKYIMRYDAKDGLQDLKKARRYLDEKIAEMEGVQTND